MYIVLDIFDLNVHDLVIMWKTVYVNILVSIRLIPFYNCVIQSLFIYYKYVCLYKFQNNVTTLIVMPAYKYDVIAISRPNLLPMLYHMVSLRMLLAHK